MMSRIIPALRLTVSENPDYIALSLDRIGFDQVTQDYAPLPWESTGGKEAEDAKFRGIRGSISFSRGKYYTDKPSVRLVLESPGEIGLRILEDAVKKMKKIHARLDRMSEREGPAHSTGHEVNRLLRAMDCELLVTTFEARWNPYRSLSPSLAVGFVNDLIERYRPAETVGAAEIMRTAGA